MATWSQYVYAALLVSIVGGCDRADKNRLALGSDSTASAEMATMTGDSPENDDTVVVAKVEMFCSGCHALPKPSSYSQEHWPREVERGFEFYFASGRHDLVTPSNAEANHYFASRSPQSLRLPSPLPIDADAAGRFRVPGTSAPPELESAVAGAGIELFRWPAPIGLMLLMSDMRSGNIMASRYTGSSLQQCQVVAKLRHPCRMTQCDLDDDGKLGLLVAELGSFLPADHSRGQVVWLRHQSDTALDFEKVVLLRGCGRVADVQAGDLDGDGDLDISVADFGWHKTGRLLWLERIADGSVDANSFVRHEIDSRSGTLQCSIHDINRDGKLDIIALIAQETESVIAYLNDGLGGFQPTVLYTASDPSFGSSGMDLCDFDSDGDTDIVYSNGDSFDRFEVKPYHGVHWLENQGDLQFTEHLVASLPGVHRAVPTDLDADGDLDIVASTFLPEHLAAFFEDQDPIAVVWIENLGDQSFRIRPLQVGKCIHPAMCVADINEDGLPDIATANFYEDASKALPPIDLMLSQ